MQQFAICVDAKGFDEYEHHVFAFQSTLRTALTEAQKAGAGTAEVASVVAGAQEIADRIKSAITGHETYNVMNAAEDGYCMSFASPDYLNPKFACDQWLAAQHPEWIARNGYHAVKTFEYSGAERMALEAAESIAALLAASPPPQEAGDAYAGAREDAAIWKKRALEAEEINRRFIAEVNGPTHMGEPVLFWDKNKVLDEFHVMRAGQSLPSGEYELALRSACATEPSAASQGSKAS